MKIKPMIQFIILFSLFIVFETSIMGQKPMSSANDSKIIFTSWDDTNSNIYVMYPDGTGLDKLTNNEYNYFSPDWSPNGKQIVYVASETKDLYIMTADGENKVNITKTPEYAVACPSWDPNGEKIVYMASRDNELLEYDIYAINSNGTGKIRLTSRGQFNGFPEWSPDGKLIAFVTDVNGSFELFIMNSDGTEQRYITTLTKNREAVEALALSWAPDGSKIAFTSDREGTFDIYVVLLSDGEIVNLSKENSSDEAFPNWSPDGKRIAFVLHKDGNTSICIMDSDGSGKAVVSPSVVNVGSLDWSGVLY